MKALGIILAAGKSTRLYPSTLVTTKQLLPVYDKPLFFYPLTTLMLAGIQDIAIITSPSEMSSFQKLMKRSMLTEAITVRGYIPQYRASGIPDAFNLVAEEFDRRMLRSYDKIVLILGDNIFHGATLTGMVNNAINETDKPAIFVTKVPDLHRFGVVTKVEGELHVVEKPSHLQDPKNSFAITGLYSFPNDVFDVARELKPSARGEKEITDVIRHYISETKIQQLRRGISWFDTGTPDSLLDASHFVKSIQKNAGQLVGSPHEVAWNNHWLKDKDLRAYLETDTKSDYAKYLNEMME